VSQPGATVCLMPTARIRLTSPDDTTRVRALAGRADLLLWSEAVVELGSDMNVNELRKLAQSAGTACAVGCIRAQSNGSGFSKYNSVVVMDRNGIHLGYYDKTCLVPWKEFMPWTAPLLFPRASSELTHGWRYPSFALKNWSGHRSNVFAATICYDTCFSSVYRRLLRQREAPDFFVVASRESADLSITLQRNILAHARFRAIECRRALVRNVECGYSGLIDSCGRLINIDPGLILRAPTLVGAVPIDDRSSLYARFGDWLPVLTCFVLIAGLVAPKRFPGRSAP